MTEYAAKDVVLSFSQQSLWFLEQLQPGTSRHHISKAWRVKGLLDAAALKRSLRLVCERHCALRTVFTSQGGTPVAHILRHAPELVERDWSGLSPAEAAREMEQLSARPFDLPVEAPARFLLARISSQEHVLLWVFHHIAVDGWSLSVFDREMTECYRAFTRGEEPELEAVPVQFHQHAARERERLDRDELDRLAAPWTVRLAGCPQLVLPGRTAQETTGGRTVVAMLEAALVEGVRAFARANRTTANAVCLAVLEALLSRYSGQTDFSLGAAYANRGDESLERAVGFFVNTLLLRADLAGDPTFRQLLERVSGAMFDALESGELPLAELVSRLQHQERSRGSGAPFNVLFAYQNFPAQGFALEGAEVSVLAVGRNAPPVADFTVTIQPVDAEAELTLWYAQQALSGLMARRFTEHYRNLLSAAIGRPDVPLAQLDFLGDEERRRLLEQGTGPRGAGERGRVDEVFAAQARATPAKAAVREGEEVLSYAELDARANRLARLLAARGLRPGGYAAVLVARSARLVECWLGVLKAGCAYVPLDPADPPERLAAQLADCGASAVICLSPPPPKVAEAVGLCVDLSGCAGELAGQPDSPPDHDALPAPAACVMFSSGSTGRPKGAAVPHRGILRLLLDNGYARFEAGDTFLFMAPPNFDASTLEVWGALLNGGCCTVLPAGVPSLQALGEAIRASRVSVLWLTSSLFNAIMDDEPEMLRGVRLLMTGGEALSVPHVRKALRLLPETRLLNGYGPTENTTFTTCWEIPPELPADTASVPIGRPIAGTRVYVLDAALRLVPAGVAGELYVGGEGVAFGYLGLPELTAERFLPDPFTEEPGARMYRTGDTVRWLDSGEIEFLGRTDNQVKIRGHRVEPGELEAALQAHPAVRQACAVVGEDEVTGKFLLAYYTLSGPALATALRGFLESRLPHYLLPRDLMEVAALPLLPSGKVDRGALLSMWSRRRSASEDKTLEPPRPGTEERVAAIWRRLLGRKIISRSDDFFELGGNSLAAVRLVATLRKELGARLQVADVFVNPVLANLAAAVAKGSSSHKEAIVLQPAGSRTPLMSLSAGPRFRNMAQHFAPERPVLALPPPDPQYLGHPCRCESLAAFHAEWLMERYPQGPWILTGWCLAGTVAFETARILSAHGAGAVILLDSPCPVQNRSHTGWEHFAYTVRSLVYHGRMLLSGRHSGVRAYIAERLVTLRDRRTLRDFDRRYQDALSSGERGFDLQDLVNYAAMHYTPPAPLAWPVLLVRAAERGRVKGRSEDWGWQPYAPQLEVAWAQGDHGTIFEEPHVAECARLVRGWLDRIKGIA